MPEALFGSLPGGANGLVSLSEQIKHNLYWFFFDGLFASASDNIIVTYVTLYILALGATRGQVGLMSSFSSLSAAVFLLAGAILVERYGRRKEFTVIFGGGVARLAILVLALLPFFIGKQAIVWVAILFSVARDSFGNLAISRLDVHYCRRCPHGRAWTFFWLTQLHYGNYGNAGHPAGWGIDHPDIHPAWISDQSGSGICFRDALDF